MRLFESRARTLLRACQLAKRFPPVFVRSYVHTLLFPNRVSEHRYGGFPLRVTLADSIGESWYDHDWEFMPEVELLSSGQLTSGATVFVAGAHQCVVAAVLAKVTGNEGSVIAVEGCKHNIEVGRQNQALNGLEQMTVLHACVAREPGYLRFDNEFCGQVIPETSRRGYRIPAVSFDQLAETHGQPSVLYIDVEGYECEVLAGSARVLSGKPDVFVEVHRGCGLEKFSGSTEEILSYLTDDEYDLYYSEGEGEPFFEVAPKQKWPEGKFFIVALAKTPH